MSDIDVILTTLELTGEAGVDITDPTYEYFFKVSPESSKLMIHMDHLLRGKMLNALISLMLMPEDDAKVEAIQFEVKTHKANGITILMYLQLFESAYKAVKDALGSSWTDEFENAWQREIKQLMVKIETNFYQLSEES